MDTPIVTWHAKLMPEENYEPTHSIFAGTCNYKQRIEVYLELWNNRGGTEDVPDLYNFNINVFFDTSEDVSLLKYCRVIVNEGTEMSLQLLDNYGIINFPTPQRLSGRHNDGIAANNNDHILRLKFIFEPPADIRLKENDLKKLYFNIVDLN